MNSKKCDSIKHKLRVDVFLSIIAPIVLITGVLSAISYFDGGILKLVGPHKPLSILLLFFSVKHIKQHWYWYKHNRQKFNGRTFNLWVLTISFVITCLTGIGAMFLSEPNNWFSIAHTLFGVIVVVFTAIHLVRYLPIMFKWITNKRSSHNK